MFEKGKFYSYTYTDTAGKHTDLYFCYATLHNGQYADLIQPIGDGVTAEYSDKYIEISSDAFAKQLLSLSIEGKSCFSSRIWERHLNELEAKEVVAEKELKELPDYGFGSDEEE